ncbi:MAG: 16S rRNA (cytosine(967)-C(5))-methyltransferase RsmB [Rhodocyclaceae bacterium]|nr:16S rRNA (cytosine(967)-C(5))-methyltransferase RsmB [Rhodocyclaceae bacterium]
MSRVFARRDPPLFHALRAAAATVAAVLSGRTPAATRAKLAAAVRPAAQDLAYSALRDYGRGDFLLAQLIERPLKDAAARALLLVALARLERRPEEAHTLVDQAVEAAAPPYRGLTNAVLRNFLRRRDELLAAAQEDAVACWRHPRWWLDKLRQAYPDDWQAIAAAGNTHPPMCLRFNRRRLAAEASPAGRPASADLAGRWLDETAYLLDRPVPVERLAGFREGWLSVQDWGAQQAARLLDVADGMRVLDACAAPGNKSAHLLERAAILLTALEQDAQRAAQIADNLARLGLSAQLRVGDARQPATWWDGQPFARILADVPCSASGVARRHPDIKWLRRPEDVAAFARLQAAILDALWPLLQPGGKMLYATCSVFPEENDAQVSAFVARHADARRLPTGGDADALQLLPSATHDGFYYALLEKTPR